jgi:hypothetical protein
MPPGTSTYMQLYRGANGWNPETIILRGITRSALPKACKDYEGSKMEVLETMKAAKIDVVSNKATDLKSKR